MNALWGLALTTDAVSPGIWMCLVCGDQSVDRSDVEHEHATVPSLSGVYPAATLSYRAESEYPTPTPDIPGDAGVPEEPNTDVRNDEVTDEPAPEEEGKP